ncbi:hypothetical protein [Actibacterium atlanticum]|nr:hypothetical protein [Actibacterium atlanticum]
MAKETGCRQPEPETPASESVVPLEWEAAPVRQEDFIKELLD